MDEILETEFRLQGLYHHNPLSSLGNLQDIRYVVTNAMT